VQKYHEISHILNYASQMCNMMLYHGKLCNIRKYDNFQFNSNILLNKVHKVIIQYPMGLHIRHKRICEISWYFCTSLHDKTSYCTPIYFLTIIFWNCYWEFIYWHFIIIYLARVIGVDMRSGERLQFVRWNVIKQLQHFVECRVLFYGTLKTVLCLSIPFKKSYHTKWSANIV
jgi:hypothetical protein